MSNRLILVWYNLSLNQNKVKINQLNSSLSPSAATTRRLANELYDKRQTRYSNAKPTISYDQNTIFLQFLSKQILDQNESTILRMWRRESETFALASPKADVVPVWYLMLVNTNSTSTSIRTCIELRYTTNSDTSIGNWVFRECPNLLQHSLRCTDPLADKYVIGTLLPPPGTLNSLFLSSFLLHSKSLTSNNCWDSSPQEGPPHFHHNKVLFRLQSYFSFILHNLTQ